MYKYITLNKIPYVKHNGYAFNLFPQNGDINIERPINILFLRYISKFDEINYSEWYYVIKDKIEDINSYSSKVKNQIKNGLNNCSIKQEYDVNKIYSIYSNVNSTYKNKVLSFKKFKNYFDIYLNIKEFKINYWLISINDTPIGYSKVCISKEKVAFYEEIHIIKAYKKNYVNYALIHIMNKYYLNECQLNFVTDGSRNIYHPTQVQDFLIYKFQFRKAFCKLHVKYNFTAKIAILFLSPFYNHLKKIKGHFFYKILTLLYQDKISKANYIILPEIRTTG